MDILKSKVTWTFLAVGMPLCSVIAYDRQNRQRIMEEYMSRARAIGSLPLHETQLPRKVSIILQGSNQQELEDKKTNFIKYALPLFDAAGCDYEYVSCSKLKLLKDYEKLEPEKDRASEENSEEGKRVKELLNNFDFVSFVMRNWMNHLNSVKEKVCPDFNLESVESVNKHNLSKVLNNSFQHPSPNSTVFKDGIVFFARKDFENAISEIERFSTPEMTKYPVLGLVDTANDTGIYRFIQFFYKSFVMQRVSRQAMAVIEGNCKPITPNSKIYEFTE